MVEAAFRHHGIDARYINCEVPPEMLGDAVRGARAMGWVGFNCSIPHKVTVIEHLDGLGESARIMGAVNCAVRRGDKFIGENTDGKGFLKSLTRGRRPARQAGRDVRRRRRGARDRRRAGARRRERDHRGQPRPRARRAAGRAPQREDAGEGRRSSSGRSATACPAGTDIVVNATSIGLYPGPRCAPRPRLSIR